MLRLALLFSLLFSLCAVADELHVLGYSHHPFTDSHYCEDNPGLGYTSDAGGSFIVFRNSLCNWTAFVNYRHPIASNDFVVVAVRAGLFWSDDDYLFGWDAGPAATLEATVFDHYVLSWLGEAFSFHYSWRF